MWESTKNHNTKQVMFKNTQFNSAERVSEGSVGEFETLSSGPSGFQILPGEPNTGKLILEIKPKSTPIFGVEVGFVSNV